MRSVDLRRFPQDAATAFTTVHVIPAFAAQCRIVILHKHRKNSHRIILNFSPTALEAHYMIVKLHKDVRPFVCQ